jgi:hypothetical protein
MIKNRVPIPNYSRYKIDLDTSFIYNKSGKRMSTHINKSGYRQISLINDRGGRRQVKVEPLVLKLLRSNENRSDEEKILILYFEHLNKYTINDHTVKWIGRIQREDPSLNTASVRLVIHKLQTGE